MSEREATITPSVKSLMPKACPRGTTWLGPGSALAAAAGASTAACWGWNAAACRASGSVRPSRPAVATIPRAVTPTLRVKARKAWRKPLLAVFHFFAISLTSFPEPKAPGANGRGPRRALHSSRFFRLHGFAFFQRKKRSSSLARWKAGENRPRFYSATRRGKYDGN